MPVSVNSSRLSVSQVQREDVRSDDRPSISRNWHCRPSGHVILKQTDAIGHAHRGIA